MYVGVCGLAPREIHFKFAWEEDGLSDRQANPEHAVK